MTKAHRLPTLILALVLALSLGLAPVAQAGGKFAAVTVDARTGAILFDKDSNGLRHPASLTKMMTLYIIFQELKAGRIKLSTPLRISARAAAKPPSKIGLKPGSTITVQQAIYALVIKSANDVAAAVGENLGGSESAFATRMTRLARTMGMNNTTYRNASGLPHPGQVTTARDQATLGLRLMRDFPQYYPYFRATSFNFRGRVIRTHNRLVGRFPGTDGIKTGYINAAGYNLVTSTKRGDKRLVGVVLGGRSASNRNAYMMSMLTKAFPKAKDGRTIAAIAGSSKGMVDPLQNLRTTDTAPVAQVPAAPEKDQAALAAVSASAAGTDEEAVAGKDASVPKVLEAQLDGGVASTSKPPQKLPFAVKPAKTQADVEALATSSVPDEWAVQIGTFKSKKSAEEVIAKLKTTDGKPKTSQTLAVNDKGKTVYRLLVSGYTEDSARKSCERVAKIGKQCAVVAPQS